jgi:peptidoglycan glycosyltransferase
LSPKYIASSYNRRQQLAENKILRGSILDRNGLVLAKSAIRGDVQQRIYPYGNLYSQVIGYNSQVYGRSLLELAYNKYLLGLDEYSRVMGAFSRTDNGIRKGDNIQTTLDHNLQKLGSKLLTGKKGAVVALNPKTGEILALVSKPDFDPNEKSLEYNWQNMTESEDSPFLPRATRGLYAPGSTYKIAISALAIENGMKDITFQDNGSVVIDGRKFSNLNGESFGKVDLTKAFALSSNVVYSQLGVMLGENLLKDMAQRLGLNSAIPFDVPVSRSLFPYQRMEKTDLASVGIGQGKLMASPLQMALVASAVADSGIMMKPYLVSSVTDPDGRNVRVNSPMQLHVAMEADTADQIRRMMQKVVEEGTGKRAAINGIRVAGKTGTAENELSAKVKNKEHSWFVGFAPAENPQIAVAVLLEYDGHTGGTFAAPIAGKIMKAYLNSSY